MTDSNFFSSQRMERKGQFPKRVQLTARCIGWSEDEVMRWLQQKMEVRG